MVNAAYRLSNRPYRCAYSVLVHLCRRKPICLRTRHARRPSNIWFVFRKWDAGSNPMSQDSSPTDCSEVDQQSLSVLVCLSVCLLVCVCLCLLKTYVALWLKSSPQVKTPRIFQYNESTWRWCFKTTQVGGWASDQYSRAVSSSSKACLPVCHNLTFLFV